jgi:hypothetical protein
VGTRLWVGGDPESLRMLALGELQPGAEACGRAVDSTGRAVSKISDDAGWKGHAAEAFKAHWDRSAVAAKVVAASCLAAAGILNELIAGLCDADSLLRTAAAAARANRVPVDEASGRAPNPWQAPDDQAATAWQIYQEKWRAAQLAALQHRLNANRDMTTLASEVGAILLGEGAEGLTGAQTAHLANYLRGLFAVPAGAHAALVEELRETRRAYDTAHAAWLVARDATPAGERMPEAVKAARSQALKELKVAREDLIVAPRARLLEALEFNVGDAARLMRVGGALTEAAEASRAVKMLADVPVLDLAAVGAATYFQSTDDMEKGEGAVRAVAESATANVTGLAAGVGAGIGVAAAVGAGAPIVAVGAAAVAGGAVAVGVGEFVYAGFNEHWDEDIHQYGYVGGVQAGVGNMFRETGKELAHMGTSVWHMFDSEQR